MSAPLSSIWSQCYPPAPTFTEKDVLPGSQKGRVFIITGGNAGVGFALVKLLYPTGATIYIASRSVTKIEAAIKEVTEASASVETPATLKALYLDLSDLATVKPAAAKVAAQETRVDIIWHNAGSGFIPGSFSQYELEPHVVVHCIAPLLFTGELLPLLKNAAKTAPKDSVRIVWTGSVRVDMNSPRGGIDIDRFHKPVTVPDNDYGASKAGAYFLAREGASRWGRFGIISVCENPGNLNTNIFADAKWLYMFFMKLFILHDARYGAYTLLFSGFSPMIDETNNGAYIWPWGRIELPARQDVVRAAEDGTPREFWQWCEEQWKKHV